MGAQPEVLRASGLLVGCDSVMEGFESLLVGYEGLLWALEYRGSRVSRSGLGCSQGKGTDGRAYKYVYAIVFLLNAVLSLITY